MAVIASATLVPPLHQTHHHTLFITEARTGAIYAFVFTLSPSGESIIYDFKSRTELDKFIPKDLKRPTFLKAMTIEIYRETFT